MRVVTYNVHGWRTAAGEPNGEQVARVLAEIRPDLVALNEVFHPAWPEASGTGRAPLLEWLARELGLHMAFGPCLRWPATQQLPARSYGNALLSRWPVLASAAHHLTPIPGKEQRGLLEVWVSLPSGTPFTVYVTHLDHTAEEARLQQFRALRSWTSRDRRRPHLLLGDFNALSPWDFAQDPGALDRLLSELPWASRLLAQDGTLQLVPAVEKAGYVDAMRRAGCPAQSTLVATDLPLRIDYVWTSVPLAEAVVSAQVWQEPPGQEASDHRPVVVDLDFDG